MKKCNITAHLPCRGLWRVVQMVVHVDQSSRTPGESPCLGEILESLEVHDMYMGWSYREVEAASLRMPPLDKGGYESRITSYNRTLYQWTQSGSRNHAFDLKRWSPYVIYFSTMGDHLQIGSLLNWITIYNNVYIKNNPITNYFFI